MSERALEFVETWVSDHIDGLPPGADAANAAALARQCLSDAIAQGIPDIEIREQFDDLAAFIGGQIVEANERKAASRSDNEEVLAEEVIAEEEADEEDEEEAAAQPGAKQAGPSDTRR